METEKILSSIPFLQEHIKRTCLQEWFDDTRKKAVRLSFELKERISYIELDLIHAEYYDEIKEKIFAIEKEFWLKGVDPMISFFLPGTGPFAARTKE